MSDLDPDLRIALHEARVCLMRSDIVGARESLKPLVHTSTYAMLVDDILRSGSRASEEYAELTIDRILNPKFKTTDACAAHVGNQHHHSPDQGSLL